MSGCADHARDFSPMQALLTSPRLLLRLFVCTLHVHLSMMWISGSRYHLAACAQTEICCWSKMLRKHTTMSPLMSPRAQPALICLKFDPPPDTNTASRLRLGLRAEASVAAALTSHARCRLSARAQLQLELKVRSIRWLELAYLLAVAGIFCIMSSACSCSRLLIFLARLSTCRNETICEHTCSVIDIVIA